MRECEKDVRERESVCVSRLISFEERGKRRGVKRKISVLPTFQVLDSKCENFSNLTRHNGTLT
jgi:hypothetical protein